MSRREHPMRPPVVRVVVDLIPEVEKRDLWFVVRMQTAWTPLEEVYSDSAREPVSAHVEGEWLDVLSGVLGSALVKAAADRLPAVLPELPYPPPQERGTASAK